MKTIIEDYISQYNIQYDFYVNLSTKACEMCERELRAQGIKAITYWRAKSPDSLRLKLEKRDKENEYKSLIDITNDIKDLSGIRIALYFPSEREVVDHIISELFNVKLKKSFPEIKQNPNYTKRFSGYWANHYRVTFKKDIEDVRYNNQIVEIQVASVLMHSWSEIEHDLVYKPNNGNLSHEEYQILDEINGLVLIGESLLERLKEAMISRLTIKSKLDDSYEMKNYLTKYIKNINSMKLGNIEYLTDWLNDFSMNNKINLNTIIKEINTSSENTIADEIIDKITIDLLSDDKKIGKLISNSKDRKNISGFERYIRMWILLEKINEYINKTYFGDSNSVSFMYNKYQKYHILNMKEATELKINRNFRNEIIHGKNMYDEVALLDWYSKLNLLVKKIIKFIKEEDVRNAFMHECVHIENLKT